MGAPLPKPAKPRAPRAPRAPRPKKPTAAARIETLEARLPPPAAHLDATALKTAVLAAVSELDARHRYGGLVPIPEVRAELVRRGVAAERDVIDAALDALEREWAIDLSMAQSPTQVADRAAGIERPGRGLLYYVARR